MLFIRASPKNYVAYVDSNTWLSFKNSAIFLWKISAADEMPYADLLKQYFLREDMNEVSL